MSLLSDFLWVFEISMVLWKWIFCINNTVNVCISASHSLPLPCLWVVDCMIEFSLKFVYATECSTNKHLWYHPDHWVMAYNNTFIAISFHIVCVSNSCSHAHSFDHFPYLNISATNFSSTPSFFRHSWYCQQSSCNAHQAIILCSTAFEHSAECSSIGPFLEFNAALTWCPFASTVSSPKSTSFTCPHYTTFRTNHKGWSSRCIATTCEGTFYLSDRVGYINGKLETWDWCATCRLEFKGQICGSSFTWWRWN